MKKFIVVAVAAMFATSAFAGDMKWSGSSAWRYTDAKYNDSLNNSLASQTRADQSEQKHHNHGLRANIGATGGWKSVEWGVGLRTQPGAANTDYMSFNQGGTDYNFNLELAWMKYLAGTNFGDFGVTIGRQKNVFAYDMTSQNFFDNDVRFDGIGVSWNWGSFGMNLSNYFLEGVSQGAAGASSYTYTAASQDDQSTQSQLNTLVGVQPHFSWKFSDQVDTMFALGYFMVDGGLSFTNSSAGVTNGTNGFVTPAGVTVPFQNGLVSMAAPRWTQFHNTWTLPYKLAFSWEYVINGNKPKFGTSFNETAGKAYSVALNYGAVKKAHDWKVGVVYGKKDLGSVISNFTGNRWLPNNKGWLLHGTYALADNFELGLKAYRLKNIDTINSTTGAQISTSQDVDTTINELTASVNF